MPAGRTCSLVSVLLPQLVGNYWRKDCVTIDVMEACSKYTLVHFRQYIMVEFLTTEEEPPIESHHGMQIVYGDDYVDVSTMHASLGQNV